MTLLTGWVALFLVIAWVLAHLLYLGPIRDVTETTLAWLLWLAATCGVVAALAVLAFGLAAGSGSPVWLRFVAWSRTGAAVAGCALVVVGRDRARHPRVHAHAGGAGAGRGALRRGLRRRAAGPAGGVGVAGGPPPSRPAGGAVLSG